ncbi:MAG: tRNA (adenosine(37)-N6)-dimethylallyltransferase MiaA [Ignavibacteriales bacterium]
MNLITILGPTATGKTKLAADLALKYNGEIISADSRQVYRSMDIGTGKDLSEYKINGVLIPYHLIDIADPKEEFNLYLFIKYFNAAFDLISSRQKVPFLVGGTGLYLDAVLRNYSMNEARKDEETLQYLNSLPVEELRQMLLELNPECHNTTDLIHKERVIAAISVARGSAQNNPAPKSKITSLVLGIHLERSVIRERITVRLKKRLHSGMIEEVNQLVRSGVSFDKLDFFGLEYKFIGQYLQGKMNYNDMFQKLNSAIHGFAKRQMTWFRKMERSGIGIHWIEGPDFNKASEVIDKYFLNNLQSPN